MERAAIASASSYLWKGVPSLRYLIAILAIVIVIGLRVPAAYHHPDIHPLAHPNTGTHVNARPDTGHRRHRSGRRSRGCRGNPHGHPGSGPHAHGNPVANGRANANPGTDTHAYADSYAYPNADAGANGYANTNPDS